VKDIEKRGQASARLQGSSAVVCRCAAAVGAAGDYLERAAELVRCRRRRRSSWIPRTATRSACSMRSRRLKAALPEAELVVGNVGHR
jgi:hypothetical protein